MATKEELVSDFKDEKIEAKMYLGLVIVQDNMNPFGQSFVNKNSAVYIKVGEIYRKIEALKDSTTF